MHGRTRNSQFKIRQSGIVSLTLVLLLTGIISSAVFGLIESNTPYLLLKRDIDMHRTRLRASVSCRDMAISHIHENADFDAVFSLENVRRVFADIALAEGKSACSVLGIERIQPVDASLLGDSAVDLSSAYRLFIIRTSGETAGDSARLHLETGVAFDERMMIVWKRSLELQI